MANRPRGYAGIQKQSRLPATGKTKAGACKAQSYEPRRSPRHRIAQLRDFRKGGKEPNSKSTLAFPDGIPQTRPPSPQKPSLKRKRNQEAQQPSPSSQDLSRSKRSRKSAPSTDEEELQRLESKASIDPLENWVLNERWPKEYFEQDNQVRDEILEHDSWQEAMMAQPPPPTVQYVEINGFRYPRPIPKVPTSLRRKQSDSSLSSAGTSEQNKREKKSIPYRDTRYTLLLAAKGSYLRDFCDDDPPGTIVDPGLRLLKRKQTVPQNTLFRNDIFKRCCRQLADSNEATVIQDIARLLVPSAKHLAMYGDRHLDILIETVNEAWAASIPVHGPRPQPDYSVGFRPQAFTKEQLGKLGPFIGTLFDTSYFVATCQMYFPFLTDEIKCGAAALDVADRQNAHSMTIAVRSVVELYKAVGREKELDREVLGFSISHDHQSVRIYGHYPVIDGDQVEFYRHQIHAFNFVVMDGRDKWTTYKFTKNVYDDWMPTHLARICSAIDQLPSGIDFSVPLASDIQFLQSTQLSQVMGGLLSGASDTSQLRQENEGEEQIPIVPQTVTPDTTVSRNEAQGKAKRSRKNRTT